MKSEAEEPRSTRTTRTEEKKIISSLLFVWFVCFVVPPLLLRPHRERRPLPVLGRVLAQLRHDDLDGLLQLRVLARDDVGRRLLDLDVRRHALVLDRVAV